MDIHCYLLLDTLIDLTKKALESSWQRGGGLFVFRFLQI